MNDLSDLKIKFNSPKIEVMEFYNQSSQLKYFGCEIGFVEENLLFVKIPKVSSIHLGGAGTNAINGAIISFLFDLALGLTSYLVLENEFRFSVTSRIQIELKKTLFANSIIAYAKVNSQKKNLVYSEAWIKDESGQICSKAKGTIFTKV